jgi:uncharacterized protein YecE (DUF72 family)
LIRIGTAGWAIPAPLREALPRDGAALERYAACFDSTEINSSFHRPHRRSTYQRWAACVGADFRFAVKLPKQISHERRLIACRDEIARFAEEVEGLGDRRGPLLIQLPPKLAFEAETVEAFLAELAGRLPGPFVCEPRHASWASSEAETLLRRHQVSRVAADPARVPALAEPGGWPDLVYYRLHGSPRIYRSAYGPERTARHATTLVALAERDIPSWTIYDNTASGAALADAFALRASVDQAG